MVSEFLISFFFSRNFIYIFFIREWNEETQRYYNTLSHKTYRSIEEGIGKGIYYF